MKTMPTLAATLLLALAIAPAVTADPGKEPAHDHDKAAKGPHGGIIVRAVEPHFEISATAGRIARIVFLDEDGKVIPPAAQTITATGGDRSNPTRLTFAPGEGGESDALLSDQPLPAGDHVPLVLRIQTSGNAEPVTERLTLHLHD